MLSRGDGVAVGVSGGADSMCLLDILISLKEELDLRLVAVHVNHGIRGASADADEHFVEAFCVQKGIDFRAVHADVPALSRELGLTEEEAGRNIRYESFEKVCRECGLSKIAVAHNSDDNAETVLFNITRGSGISGLRGIAPVRALKEYSVIRPILCCSRAEIEEYLCKKGIAYRTDETNLTDDYSRNLVRNRILPILREGINSGVSAHIAELAAQAAELEEFVSSSAEEIIDKFKDEGRLRYTFNSNGCPTGAVIEAEGLTGLKRAVRTAVIRLLTGQIAGKLKDIEAVHIKAAEGLLEASVGKRVSLPYGIIVRRDYKELVFERHFSAPGETDKGGAKRVAAERIQLPADPSGFPAEYDLPDGYKLYCTLIPCEKNLNIPRNDYTKYFDYDKIKGNIELRTRREGDYMLIKSSTGTNGELHRKSLKSALIDMKIPAYERDGLVLMAEAGHVLWILGHRGDDSCYVTEETGRILKAELTKNA